MTSAQLALAAHPHRNQRLFSDHYLDTILPQASDWKLGADGAAETLRRLRDLYQSFTPSTNEAQTERDWVRPVLEALGHSFEVQPTLRTPDGTKRPDYILYQDEAAVRANKNVTLTDDLLHQALAVADAKYWDRPLDQALKVGTDPFTNKNPGYQISFYIQHAGLPWGILPNGRLWRLYHKASAHKLDQYYEVALPELLDRGDPQQFQYFLRFFERSAFEEGPLSLNRHLEASTSYARSVGEGLRGQVYDALLHVAQGFLDFPRNDFTPDPAALKQIYDNGLILLYRLLFVLYAEARNLLPVEESAQYRDQYSLSAIKRSVAEDVRYGQTLLPGTATLWPRLTALFDIINRGSPPLKVATFNGGLFDPARYPFLEQYSVGDAHLQQAIDKLTRVEGEFVDYRDLSERHLGTIYEGLLEFQLRPLETGPDAPAEDSAASREGWTVKLVTDKGERKLSGSYYTPGFITHYMVEEAVGPVVTAALESAAAKGAEAQVQAVLNVNVLDCSMGSGHFLVEATEYIARRLVEADLLPPDLRTSGGMAVDEFAYWKRRVAQSCVYGVDLNPLAVDLAKLSLWLTTAARDRPLSFLDHHLRPGNALVGARLDELKPGMKKKAAGRKIQRAEAGGQLTWATDSAFTQTMKLAVDNMWLIEESAAATIEDVKAQEKLYETAREAFIRKYSPPADLVTATHFGLEVDDALLGPLTEYALGRTIAAPPQFRKWLEEAEALAEQHRFFHWELEFPEVFFDRYGRSLGEEAGFDVVVGNPPYVRQERLAPLKAYLEETFRAYHGVADLYVYFYEQGLRLLRQGGRMAYIVTNKWMRSGYGEPLRAFFAEQNALERIIDFGHAPIFADVDVFPCILVFEKPAAPVERQVRITLFPREVLRSVELDRYVRENTHTVPHRRFGRPAWNLEPTAVEDLLVKIRRVGIPLTEFAGVKPYRGVVTGFNEAFLIDTPTKDQLVREDPRSAEILKPYLRGQDIKRWVPSWQGLWMIFARRGISIDEYPAVKQHLLSFRERLEPRPGDWQGDRWAGRKPGLYHWYEIQDTVDYWPLFEQPKLMYQEIQFHPAYCLDTTGFFSNNKAFLLPKADRYLLAVLNSPLMWWHNWRYLPHMKDEALSPVGDLMERLPIAPATDAIREQVEPAAGRLIALTGERRAKLGDVLEWLRVEFSVEAPGQKLQSFPALDEAAFVEEVRRARPRTAARLSPAGLRDLQNAYSENAPAIHTLEVETGRHERRLADLVNQAYGLTAEEVALLWSTAPPRMPRAAQDA
jgi:Eco57I restriction-modification methylase/restriction endonuclease TaqI-like protein